MNDILRKALLFGIGSVSLTKEKVEEAVKELKKKGQLSEKEGRKLVNEVLTRSLKEQKRVRGIVENAVKEVIKGSSVAKRVKKVRRKKR
jgi:polyhydroxyalkanoate synthesis regulator phasin